MSHYFLCSQNKHSKIRRFFQVVAAKQNQKFPFHFLSAPPTPPAENQRKEGKFLVFARDRRERTRRTESERTLQFRAATRSARTKLGILLEMGSDFFKQTPQ
jgi:hypothetical protein